MKINFTTVEGKTTLSAEADGRWDGFPPNRDLSVHAIPISVDPDRVAVAATLVYGEYFGGVVDFGRRINLVTTSAIHEFCAPVRIYPTDIDQGPKPIRTGGYTLRITDNDRWTPRALLNQNFETRHLVLLESNNFDGAVAFHRGILASSNAWTFMNTSRRRDLIKIAIGVLFAETYDAGLIYISSKGTIDPAFELRIRNLLSSVGLNLAYELEGEL